MTLTTSRCRWRHSSKLMTSFDVSCHISWIVGTGHFWPTPIGSRVTSKLSDRGSWYSDVDDQLMSLAIFQQVRLNRLWSFVVLQPTTKFLNLTSSLIGMSMRWSILERSLLLELAAIRFLHVTEYEIWPNYSNFRAMTLKMFTVKHKCSLGSPSIGTRGNGNVCNGADCNRLLEHIIYRTSRH